MVTTFIYLCVGNTLFWGNLGQNIKIISPFYNVVWRSKNRTGTYKIWFEVDLSPSQKLLYLLQWKPFKIDEIDAFYFLLKALFVLKIFRLFSWLLGVEKTASSEIWLETTWMKFGLLI